MNISNLDYCQLLSEKTRISGGVADGLMLSKPLIDPNTGLLLGISSISAMSMAIGPDSKVMITGFVNNGFDENGLAFSTSGSTSSATSGD